MRSAYQENKYLRVGVRIAGFLLLPAIWWLLKDVLLVPDRFLPSYSAVLSAVADIEPHVLWHTFYTASRFAIGFILSIFLGIGLGLVLSRYSLLFDLFMPAVQSTRAIPALAIVPFFLVWFGFSEAGKYILIIVGTSFNIAVASLQILKAVPEKDQIMFRSYGLRPEQLTVDYGWPRVLENILPTLRFSLSMALGLIIISELLGDQIGLGYLIQTSRSNYAMHVVVLATIFLSVLNVAADWLLRYCWSKLVFWRVT